MLITFCHWTIHGVLIFYLWWFTFDMVSWRNHKNPNLTTLRSFLGIINPYIPWWFLLNMSAKLALWYKLLRIVDGYEIINKIKHLRYTESVHYHLSKPIVLMFLYVTGATPRNSQLSLWQILLYWVHCHPLS